MALLFVKSVGISCFADDVLAPVQAASPASHGALPAGSSSGSIGDSIQTPDLIANAIATFSGLKREGTVWLRTQNWIDELKQLKNPNESVKAKQLAIRILQDCENIENQFNLERARYLLATLETKQADESDINAIRMMLKDADGEAALALAEAAMASVTQ